VLPGPDGGFLVVDGNQYWIGSTAPDGGVAVVAGSGMGWGNTDDLGISALLAQVSSLLVDPASGVVYFASSAEPGIRTFDPATGQVKTWLADVGSGPGVGGRALARDAAGNFYLAEDATQVIRKITPQGVSSVLAGTSGQSGFQDGQGAAARFNSPVGIAVDRQGNVFVSDAANRAIRRISPDGNVVTLVGVNEDVPPADGPPAVARLSWPQAMTIDASGTLYFCDSAMIRSAAPDGTVSTLLGDWSVLPGHDDGEGGAASMAPGSCGITLDEAGNLLVAEYGSGLVRRLTRSGSTWTVRTILGTAGPSRVSTGPLGTASLARPRAIGVLPGGDLVLGDSAARALLVARACQSTGACACTADSDCLRGSICQSGSCKVSVWAVHLGEPCSFGIPSTPDLYPGNDFTMEMRIKMDYAAYFGGSIYRKWVDGTEDKHFHWNASSVAGRPTDALYIGFAGPANPYSALYFEPPEAQVWHHVAISSDGTTERVFIDGHLTGTLDAGSYAIQDSNGPLYFGKFVNGDPVTSATFSLSEVRLSSGDRYSGDFVPPATMTADAKTRGLWHLDAGVGTTIPDLSGHGHDGTLSGPLGWESMNGP
jgi:streptogramin lyase